MKEKMLKREWQKYSKRKRERKRETERESNKGRVNIE